MQNCRLLPRTMTTAATNFDQKGQKWPSCCHELWHPTGCSRPPWGRPALLGTASTSATRPPNRRRARQITAFRPRDHRTRYVTRPRHRRELPPVGSTKRLAWVPRQGPQRPWTQGPRDKDAPPPKKITPSPAGAGMPQRRFHAGGYGPHLPQHAEPNAGFYEPREGLPQQGPRLSP